MMAEGKEKVEEFQEKPKHKRRIDPQVVTAIALTIISLCALVVSLQQTRILAEQQKVTTDAAKAQLWPFLELGASTGFNDEGIAALHLNVSNSGTGPAIVEGVRLTYLDSVLTDWWDFLEMIPMPDSVNLSLRNSSISNRVIQAGEHYVAISFTENPPLMHAFFHHFKKADEQAEIEVYYRSVFDEHWLLKGNLFGDMTTTEVSGCPISEEDQFNS